MRERGGVGVGGVGGELDRNIPAPQQLRAHTPFSSSRKTWQWNETESEEEESCGAERGRKGGDRVGRQKKVLQMEMEEEEEEAGKQRKLRRGKEDHLAFSNKCHIVLALPLPSDGIRPDPVLHQSHQCENTIFSFVLQPIGRGNNNSIKEFGCIRA